MAPVSLDPGGPCILCGASCKPEEFCHGCQHHICNAHGDSPWGNHEPEEHDEE